MSHPNVIRFTRRIAAIVALFVPVVLGCGTKPETSPNDQAVTPPAVLPTEPAAAEPPAAPVASDGPEEAALEAPANQPLSDAELVKETFGAPSTAAVPDRPTGPVDDAEAEEADRPRSFFRSIGRALQKGVTDAVGFTSDTSQASDESDPGEPN